MTTWEYWPWWIVYAPVYLYYLFNVCRLGKWFYFSTVNLSMHNGGFFGNTKSEMYGLLPPDSYPKFILLDGRQSFNINTVQDHLNFPMIAKPEIGERGFGVKKLFTIEDLQSYHAQSPYPYLLQDYSNYANELSVFCIKDIPTQQFHVTSIVGKKLLSIIGDGQHTILELIHKNERAFLQIDRLHAKWQNMYSKVLSANEELFLIDNANHSKGASFFAIHNKRAEIETLFKSISMQIEGFNYGRFDVKYDSIDGLLQGRYSIIELNGVGAEPIDMYIPKIPLFKGWAILINHWKKMYAIADFNIHTLKHQATPKREGFALLRTYLKYKGKDIW